MKIEQQPQEFRPITITLESNEEGRIFRGLIVASATCFHPGSPPHAMAEKIGKELTNIIT